MVWLQRPVTSNRSTDAAMLHPPWPVRKGRVFIACPQGYIPRKTNPIGPAATGEGKKRRSCPRNWLRFRMPILHASISNFFLPQRLRSFHSAADWLRFAQFIPPAASWAALLPGIPPNAQGSLLVPSRLTPQDGKNGISRRAAGTQSMP